MSGMRHEAPDAQEPLTGRRAARAAARAQRRGAKAARAAGGERDGVVRSTGRADAPHRRLADAGRAGARAIFGTTRSTRRPVPALPRHGGHL